AAVHQGARRALAAWARRPQRHEHAGGGHVVATALAEGDAGAFAANVEVDDAYDFTALAGLAAAQGLLAGRGEPGLAAWGSLTGAPEEAAAATGARLLPVRETRTSATFPYSVY